MEKTRKWRKILAMMLTVVMMLQNAQSVMVFADVTNEQIEQRLAGAGSTGACVGTRISVFSHV